MQTVESLIRELQKFPSDARCHAYEGETITAPDGRRYHAYVVVTDKHSEQELACIPCDGGRELDAGAVTP